MQFETLIRFAFIHDLEEIGLLGAICPNRSFDQRFGYTIFDIDDVKTFSTTTDNERECFHTEARQRRKEALVDIARVGAFDETYFFPVGYL